MSDNRFVALDFETLETWRGSVCSVGAVLFEDGKVKERFYSLVCPPSKMENPYCVEAHGLHYSDVKDAPKFDEVWEKIDGMIGESRIVAHNAPFEKSCINACGEEYGTKTDYEYIDTLKLSRKYYKKMYCHKLNEMCRKFRIKLDHYHNALDDAEACGWLYIKIMNEQNGKDGNRERIDD